MPPHTTYLRITPHSVLQVRVFTEQPLDAGKRWLIHPTDPALPRIIQAIKHLILPKLREENFRKYGAKSGIRPGPDGPGRGVRGKKRVKDVVVTDGFDVSVFLTELGTRHSLLVKQKLFEDKKRKLTGNSTKMAEAMDQGNTVEEAVVIREETPDEDSAKIMEQIPVQPKRKRRRRDDEHEAIEVDEEEDAAEVITSDDETAPVDPEMDDKKKAGFKTSYEGFSIWGWTLVLIVKRKDDGSKRKAAEGPISAMMGLRDPNPANNDLSGGLMEEWICTQAAGDVVFDDEDVGN
ncbi:hypothetical protein UCRPC4_g02001 [Phaeomoniella chlamydospora]|uniref:Uncharacterized protein n=1 Tax=Phaeomoniella chlamydospora TaxID=158046 RepID=A0A0G2H9A7_PHACM|nr:hypothetical protein UCRPC4_g02001 [Phaeomoniella chlamydospora]